MKGLLFIMLLVLAGPAQAHKLKLFVTAEGAVISGTAYFSGGAKAADVAGRVLAPDGSVVEDLRTDGDGGFRVQARLRMDHAIVVDGGDGHAASAVVTAAELPESLPPGIAGPPRLPSATADTMAVVPVEAIEAAVARQIQPLRRQLDAYEDKVRLHDILGGIGTIFGVFGVAAWWSAGRRKP